LGIPSEGKIILIQGCAEKLFTTLVSKNRAVLCPFIMESLLSLPQDLSSSTLLLKEAVYSSVALCSHDLYDYLNFDEWAVNCLFNETLIKIDE
jgi:hypothetical protein